MQIAYDLTGKLIHVDPEYGFYWTIKDYPGSSRAIMSEPQIHTDGMMNHDAPHHPTKIKPAGFSFG